MVSNVTENLVEGLISMLKECSEKDKSILISGENVESHFVCSFVPKRVDWSSSEQKLYIEGEDFTLSIKNVEDVEYDECEDAYFVKQDNITYCFNC